MNLTGLESLFAPHKGKKLLCVFPHADDESFVSGGLFQLAQKIGIKTKVVILTRGTPEEMHTEARKEELAKAVNILGVDEYKTYEFAENNLKGNIKVLKKRLEKEISDPDVFLVLTFDPTGVTGHEDHIVASIELLQILKSLKGKRPLLIWRIPDNHEQNFFLKEKKLPMVRSATYVYNLSLNESFKKLKAIFSYRSQLKNLFFRLRVIEWYLFDHRELYHLVDVGKENIKLKYE